MNYKRFLLPYEDICRIDDNSDLRIIHNMRGDFNVYISNKITLPEGFVEKTGFDNAEQCREYLNSVKVAIPYIKIKSGIEEKIRDDFKL